MIDDRDEIDQQIARLDARIAWHDVDDTDHADWRWADDVWHKADLLEQRDGEAAALPLYQGIVERLASSTEPGAVALWIAAANSSAVILHHLERLAESESLAARVVDARFEDAPIWAELSIVNATLLLARLLDHRGDTPGSLVLIDRLLARYATPEWPGHRRTRAIAGVEAGAALDRAGQLDNGIERFTDAITAIGDSADLELRRILAEALAGKAYLLWVQNNNRERDATCRVLINRCADLTDPSTIARVGWAKNVLRNHSSGSASNRFRRRP